MSYLPTKIGWFRLPEHVQGISDRVTVLESTPDASTLQSVTTAGNITTLGITIGGAIQGADSIGTDIGDVDNSGGGIFPSIDTISVYNDTSSVDLKATAGAPSINLGDNTIGSIVINYRGTAATIDTKTIPDGDGDLGLKVAVPATAASPGDVGNWAAESGFLYICVATNTWERVAIATW